MAWLAAIETWLLSHWNPRLRALRGYMSAVAAVGAHHVPAVAIRHTTFALAFAALATFTAFAFALAAVGVAISSKCQDFFLCRA